MICKERDTGKEIHIPFGGALVFFLFEWVKLTPEDAVAISKMPLQERGYYMANLALKICAKPQEPTEVPE